MCWPDAIALLRHWQHDPPTNELLAAFLGAERKASRSALPGEDDDAASVMEATGVSKEEFDQLLRQHGIAGMIQ